MSESLSYAGRTDPRQTLDGWEMLEGVARPDGSVMENRLERLPLPGGWLVRYNYDTDLSHGASITFVPDVDHAWCVTQRDD